MKILDVPQSGSVAGVTSSRNRYGQYRRTRAVPVNPATAKQTAVRSAFASFSQQWTTALSDAQRTGWREWADNHPITDSLGQSITLTGFAWFVRANMALLPGSVFSPVSDPPSSETVGQVSPAMSTLSTTVATFTFDGSIPTGGVMQIEATPPVNAGVTFPTGWRQVAVKADDTTTPVALSTPYNAVFGLRQIGQRIFWRARFVTLEGVYGPWEQFSKVVA